MFVVSVHWLALRKLARASPIRLECALAVSHARCSIASSRARPPTALQVLRAQSLPRKMFTLTATAVWVVIVVAQLISMAILVALIVLRSRLRWRATVRRL
jgi:hypothetical protein